MKSLAKLSIYVLFLNYYFAIIVRGSLIPYVTYLVYGILLLYFLISRKIIWGKELKAWMIYLGLSFLTITFAQSSAYATEGLIKFVQRLILILAIADICKKEKSISFAVSLLTVTATSCGIAILTNLSSVQGRLSLENDANISVNDVGSIMAYGCFAILLFSKYIVKKDFLQYISVAAGSVLFIVVIFLSGSRKAFYAIIIFYAILLITGTLKIKSASQLIGMVLIGVVVWKFIDNNLLDMMSETSLFERIWGDKAVVAEASDVGRMSLYRLALLDFIQHPLIGLGYNNFTYVHRVYTHSTYVEPLACSGLIGLFYLYPYVRIIKQQLFLIKEAIKGKLDVIYEKQMFAFLVMFLFIGVGIPYIYKDIPCIVLAMFIASQSIGRERLARSAEKV